MNPIMRPWRQLFDFSGRATRTEYALFHVTAILLFIAFEVLVRLIGQVFFPVAATSQPGAGRGAFAAMLGLVSLVLLALVLIGHVSIAIRRLHDHGEPWLKYLLTFIPFIGFIFWIMLVFAKGDDCENDYGPDPRQPEQIGVDELGSVFR